MRMIFLRNWPNIIKFPSITSGRWYCGKEYTNKLILNLQDFCAHGYLREYFGRENGAEQKATERNDEITLDKNAVKFNLDSTEFCPQAGTYLHEDGRWFVQYRDPLDYDKFKREYFGRGLQNEANARSRKEEILCGNFHILESSIRKRLVIELMSNFKIKKIKTEAKTEVGYIDILTPKCIIEVKYISYWKNAIGQVMAYGFYHPDKKKSIHLFGKASRKLKKTIADVCNSLDIPATFES